MKFEGGKADLRHDSKTQYLIMTAIGGIAVFILGILLSPYLVGGLPQLMRVIGSGDFNLSDLRFDLHAFKVAGGCLFLYVFAVVGFSNFQYNRRPGAEFGSAGWGSISEMRRKYQNKDRSQNRIITQNLLMSMDSYRTRRNLNVLVIGGSGAGKTRFYAKPNILQANSSYVILDPKGELLEDTGGFLQEMDYEIKVLDLMNLSDSDQYNPFRYLRNDHDVQKMVTMIFRATTPKGQSSSDPFWDLAAQSLLMALCLFLFHECDPSEQNFAMVMEMIRHGSVEEDSFQPVESPLDRVFNVLEDRNPNHIALQYYRGYKTGAAKTLKSIQITLVARLDKFNIKELANLTAEDTLELENLGRRKTALFAKIPITDTSFNFLVSLLYSQVFQVLYEVASKEPGRRLPCHVHCVMDEFANVKLPEDFEKVISTCRSYNISISVILQNLAQLKGLFEKDAWENIAGNCDTFLYLGGNEDSTFDYVSKQLGKETMSKRSYSQQRGLKGSLSTSDDITARELLTPDEVRRLPTDDAIAIVRGEKPIYDKKYDLMKHPNINLSADGKGGKAFVYKPEKRSLSYVSISARVMPEQDTFEPFVIVDNEGNKRYVFEAQANDFGYPSISLVSYLLADFQFTTFN